jgi:hypothetical protein
MTELRWEGSRIIVAFAVAEGFGDAEAVAGGGEGEGEFGDLATAFGGEFALKGS